MILFRLIKEGFLFAINSIIVNKLRTFLSLFGITIGIFAIISVFTVLDWMERSIKDSIATLGDDVLYVQKMPWSFDPNIAWWDIIMWPQPDMDDYEAIRRNSSRAEAANYSVFFSRNLKYLDRLVNDAMIWATTHELEDVRNFDIEEGRYFSPYESSSGKPVVVLGAVTAESVFEDVNPIGKEISIGGHKVQVIGVFKKEGEGGLSDSGMDEVVLMPVKYARNIVNLRNRFTEANIIIKAREGISTQELSDETVQILRAARRLGPGEESNFSVNKASLLTQGFESVFAGINVGGWIIGGFSILVGGFGIANIMFVSVKERTNQIGIQKALGAKKRFILWQFLYESILLSIIGGIFGLFFIFIGTLVVNYLFDLSIYLTLANIFMAIFISGTIGVVAGYAPAYAAAKMNPVDAIGYSFG
ncbi:MAG: ABC transporter permease [Marinilabiliaceae bacterium]|jgi:putative ABC transport system permease protein|nr:ABC transporter permease [Marinilabiliaceae bacterium]